MSIYIVTFTSYEDDYKHRYDNGVYPDEPRLFSTEKKALDYINEELKERLERMFADCVDEEFRHYFDIVKSEGRWGIEESCVIKAKYLKRNELKKMYEVMAKGANVPYIFDWTLSEAEVD